MIAMAGSAEMKLFGSTSRKMPENCRKKVARLGITDYKNSNELLAKLRALPAEKFAVSVKVFKKDRDETNLFESIPYIDDSNFFPGSLDELRKKAIPKPLITGVTKEEGILFLVGIKPTEENLRRATKIAAIDSPDNENLTNELRSLYINDDIVKDKKKLKRAIASMVSDYFMNAGALELCRKTVSAQDEPVYLYVFDQFNRSAMGIFARMIPIQDTTHGCEVMYFFKKSVFLLYSIPTLTEGDRRVMDIFTTALTNFAKFGNPNGSASSTDTLPADWKPLDKANCSRNFTFKACQIRMKESLFEGRTEKYIEILKNA